MKKINHETRYDGATADEVFAMLGDADYRDAVGRYQLYTRRDVTMTPSGDGFTAVMDQFRPADEVPSFAKKFVGAEINIKQEEAWRSPAEGTITVGIPGKPGSMEGTARIAADEEGSTIVVDAQVKVSIPLIGGKLEDFIGSMMIRALKAEGKVGRRWLDGARGPELWQR